jgi:hypothetical protein
MADSIAEFARKVQEALGLGKKETLPKREPRKAEVIEPNTARALEVTLTRPEYGHAYDASGKDLGIARELDAPRTAPYKAGDTMSGPRGKVDVAGGRASQTVQERPTVVGPVPAERLRGDGIQEKPVGMQAPKTGSDIADERQPGDYMGRAGEAIANRIKSAAGIRERTPEEKAANSRYIPDSSDEAIAKRTANIPGREKLQAMADYLARKQAGIETPEAPKPGSYEWEVEQSKKRQEEAAMKRDLIRQKMAEGLKEVK